jgi:pilus assembly protein CpaF
VSLIGSWGASQGEAPKPGMSQLADHEVLKRSVHHRLLDLLGPTLYDPHMPEQELADKVRSTVQMVVGGQHTVIPEPDRAQLVREILDDILGYGPIQPFLLDPEITEVMVNGHRQIYVKKDGLLHETPAVFADEDHLRRTIDKIVSRVGRRVDEASPMVDARLPDGSRVNAVVAPI